MYLKKIVPFFSSFLSLYILPVFLHLHAGFFFLNPTFAFVAPAEKKMRIIDFFTLFRVRRNKKKMTFLTSGFFPLPLSLFFFFLSAHFILKGLSEVGGKKIVAERETEINRFFSSPFVGEKRCWLFF